MQGLVENNSIERLDLSDNDLQDSVHSVSIVRFIKNQGEKRENTLWMTGLRHSNLEPKSL